MAREQAAGKPSALKRLIDWLGDNGELHGDEAVQVPAQDIPQQERYIQRTSLQARITHGFVAVTCLYLVFSGLFVLVKPIGVLVGPDAVFWLRMSHRVIGVLFVAFPIVSAILAPSGLKHVGFNLFHPWNKDDWIFMAKFPFYLLACKLTHMPDQDDTKSGQRFADGAIWAVCLFMGISGVGLLLGDTLLPQPEWLMLTWRFIHDLFFLVLVVFGMAHIYIGAGIFEPYHGAARIMWGDGRVKESFALYHWGKYARREIAYGKNLTVKREGAGATGANSAAAEVSAAAGVAPKAEGE